MYGIKSAADAQKAYDDAKADAVKEIAAKPQDANEIAQSLLVAEATLIAWGTWERIAQAIDDHAVGQDFSEEYVWMMKFAELATLALRSPDDTWSGRGNDAKRAKNEAMREVYVDVLRKMQLKAGL
jgi:hypothetical protein